MTTIKPLIIKPLIIRPLIIFIFWLGTIFSAKADIHIEPYASLGGSYSSSLSSQYSFFLNYDLGGRVGYKLSPVTVGLDMFWTYYDTATGVGSNTLEITKSPEENVGFSQANSSLNYSRISQPNTSFKPLAIGGFVAFELPFLFDVYGGGFYSWGSKDSLSYSGFGLKVGASYLSAYFAQLNLELKWAHYLCGEGQNSSCPEEGANHNIFSVIVSVSVPLSMSMFGPKDSDEEEADTEQNPLSENNLNENNTASIF